MHVTLVSVIVFNPMVGHLPCFSDYKMHFPPQIWEENGGESYSPNVAYLAHCPGRGLVVEWGFSPLFSSSKTQVCLMVRCILQPEKYGISIPFIVSVVEILRYNIVANIANNKVKVRFSSEKMRQHQGKNVNFLLNMLQYFAQSSFTFNLSLCVLKITFVKIFF